MADFNEMLTNTPDTTAEYDPNDIEQNKVMALLAYLSILVLIPIFAAPRSKFARFHVNQGIVLAIAEVIASILAGILTSIPFIGWLFGIVFGLIDLAAFILAVLGILNAVNGKAKELPFIGKFRLLK